MIRIVDFIRISTIYLHCVKYLINGRFFFYMIHLKIPNTHTFTSGKNLTCIMMTHGENHIADKHDYVGNFLWPCLQAELPTY